MKLLLLLLIRDLNPGGRIVGNLMTYYENFGANSFDKVNSPQGKPFGRVTELIEHRVLELRTGLFFQLSYSYF
jgi:hypothetical protein